MNGQELAAPVTKSLSGVLSPHGFKKRGGAYVVDGPDVVLMIQVQKSTSSTKDKAILTVNLRIFSKTIAARLGYPIDRPSISTGHWRVRIGELGPTQNDYWWPLSNEAEAAKAEEEIKTILKETGVPLLLSLSSTDRLLALWKTGKSPGITPTQREDYIAALSK